MMNNLTSKSMMNNFTFRSKALTAVVTAIVAVLLFTLVINAPFGTATIYAIAAVGLVGIFAMTMFLEKGENISLTAQASIRQYLGKVKVYQVAALIVAGIIIEGCVMSFPVWLTILEFVIGCIVVCYMWSRERHIPTNDITYNDEDDDSNDEEDEEEESPEDEEEEDNELTFDERKEKLEEEYPVSSEEWMNRHRAERILSMIQDANLPATRHEEIRSQAQAILDDVDEKLADDYQEQVDILEVVYRNDFNEWMESIDNALREEFDI